MTLRFGIDRLLADPVLRKPLEGRRVALLAHPASVTADLPHSLDALVAAGVNLTAIFGPQHGVRGDLQDNMMESPDFTDQIGSAHVWTPDTTAHLVSRLLLEKTKSIHQPTPT